MTFTAPTISQIKAQVAAIRRKVPDANAVGIHAAGRWAGQSEYQDGDETFLIEQCDSPLAIRIALRKRVAKDATTVVVTSLEDRDLDDDICLRLAKRRLHPIDNWQIVKSLFQAHAIDPRVSQNPWMAEELLRLMPSEGYAPAAGGFLDADRVWSILLRHHFNMTNGRPDLVSLLVWSLDNESSMRWQAASEHLRESAIRWLAQTAGPVAPFALHIVGTHNPGDAVACGLVLGVVYCDAASGKLERAIGKLEERFFGPDLPEPLLRNRWSDTATEVVRMHLADRRVRGSVVDRSDQILRDIGALDFAHLSDLSPNGFDQRLRMFASELTISMAARSGSSLDRLLQARSRVLDHDRAQMEPRRMASVDMALRLLKWRSDSKASSADWSSLSEAAQYHETTGSFLDWARLSLRAGDPVREFSEALSDLLASMTSVRDKHANTFAELLRDWTASGTPPTGVVPVEDIISKVVAPLASETSLLVIVLDGMSFAVWRELESDLLEHEWAPIVANDESSPTIGLAAVPSVTEASRTSLLCGTCRTGSSSDERSVFQSHPDLLRVCKAGKPPRLFHKAALTEADDVVLAGEVRDAIADSGNRIIGVVVNAIDDHLFKGEQMDVHWTRDQIRVLPALLYEARASDRRVVLLSDHGHVLDHGSVGTRVDEGGERWRPDDGAPKSGEVAIRGQRVLLSETGAIIGLATEQARFGSKRNGYHGGLTPQEMLVPIVVLCGDGDAPTGWTELPPVTPEWWDIEPRDAHEMPCAVSAETMIASELLFPEMEDRTEQGQIDAESPTWIIDLVTCSLFNEQKSLAGRTVPSNNEFVQLLAALDSRGGRMTAAALARILSRSVHRLNGLFAVCQRVLNVDGYPVLSRDDASDTVELDVSLAKRQFGLKE